MYWILSKIIKLFKSSKNWTKLASYAGRKTTFTCLFIFSCYENSWIREQFEGKITTLLQIFWVFKMEILTVFLGWSRFDRLPWDNNKWFLGQHFQWYCTRSQYHYQRSQTKYRDSRKQSDIACSKLFARKWFNGQSSPDFTDFRDHFAIFSDVDINAQHVTNTFFSLRSVPNL